MKFFTKEVKIALVAILAIIVLFIGMQFLKGMSLFSRDDVYYVSFSDVSGLTASSPVYANGYRVGVVQRIDYNYEHPDHIVAAVDLHPQLRLTRGSQARITSDFLGNVKLELYIAPAEGGFLAKGDTIEGCMDGGLMSKAAAIVPQLEQMLPKLDSILSSVNVLLADPAIDGTLHNAEQLTASLSATSRQLGLLTARLVREVPAMTEKANGVLANAEALTGSLSRTDLEGTMKKVDATLANVEQLTRSLISSQGTVGMLLGDPQLYHHLNAAMRDVDSLLVDFKLHPRRYINVSVFGKKAK